jgi:hypothetical protein
VCGDGNPDPITLGADIATSGGQIQSAFTELRDCWETTHFGREKPWNITLVVISCPSNNVGTCEEVKGAVNVNVLWITGPGNDPGYNDAPTEMGGVAGYGAWPTTAERAAITDFDNNGEGRWGSFVNHFNLQNVDGSDAPYDKKSIYFLPDCDPHDLAGNTGGTNYGILAKIPVLVR